tara:strand:+ start:482 stop:661 length:180 start_codon:yes stop_codon:yes gene_type:complete
MSFSQKALMPNAEKRKERATSAKVYLPCHCHRGAILSTLAAGEAQPIKTSARIERTNNE